MQKQDVRGRDAAIFLKIARHVRQGRGAGSRAPTRIGRNGPPPKRRGARGDASGESATERGRRSEGVCWPTGCGQPLSACRLGPGRIPRRCRDSDARLLESVLFCADQALREAI